MNIWSWSVRRPVASTMMVATIVVLGFISLQQMPVALMPELSYPTLTIRFAYEGAAPAEVESELVDPAEELLRTLEGVRELESVSRAGGAELVLRYHPGVELSAASQRVRERIASVPLPDAVQNPDILRYDPTLEPILRVAFYGAEDLVQAGVFAEKVLGPWLESVSGVASVRVSGTAEPQLGVQIDPQLAQERGVDVEDVSDALIRENIATAGGRVEDAGHEFIVRTLSTLDSLDDVREVRLNPGDERPLTVGDLATVQLVTGEPTSLIRINDRTGVELEVFREADANLVATAAGVRERLDGWEDDPVIGGSAPNGATLRILDDRSEYIRAAVDEVGKTALYGAVFAVLVLLIFLRRLWVTFTISLAIPLSVVASFVPLRAAGVSLNVMSLGGLALGIGMLVDNAIVVIESIVRCEEEGDDRISAVIRGTAEVGGAVTASTLTTIAVFAPVFFMQEQAGQLFRDLSAAVVFSLLASLAFALFFVPMLIALPARFHGRAASLSDVAGDSDDARLATLSAAGADLSGWMDGLRDGGSVRRVLSVIPGIVWPLWVVARTLVFLPLEFLFLRLIPTVVGWMTALARRRSGRESIDDASSRRTVEGRVLRFYRSGLGVAIGRRALVGTLALLLIPFSLWLARDLDVEILPELHQGHLIVSGSLPVGTSLHETDAVVAEMVTAVQALDGVREVSARAGSVDTGETGDFTATHELELRVGLTSSEQPIAHEERVLEELRGILVTIPDLDWSASRPELVVLPAGAQVFVFGNDLGDLQRTGDRLAEELQADTRLASVVRHQRSGYPEVRIEPRRDRLAAFGLTARDIGERLRQRVLGDVPGMVRFSGDPLDIRVSMRPEGGEALSLGTLQNMRIPLNNLRAEVRDGQVGTGVSTVRLEEDLQRLTGAEQGGRAEVPLSEVAEIRHATGPSEIRHLDGRRVARLDVWAANDSPAVAGEAVAEALDAVAVPVGQSVRVAGQAATWQQSRRSLIHAFLIAVFLVYVVLASRFEAFVAPLVILSVVPLSFVGVAVALRVTATPVSALVFVGLIVMAGIVVNNAIVLVDYSLQLLRRGMDPDEAVLEAAVSRFRPIWITTLTTVLGLVPMLAAGSEGAELRAPLALVVVSGLLSCTVLTLVILPAVQVAALRARRLVTTDRGHTSASP